MKKLFSLLTLALLTMSAWAANTYVKVTSTDQLEADKKYILVNEEANKAMGAIVTYGSNDVGSTVDITITDGVINIDNTAAVELTLGQGSQDATGNATWTFDIGGEGHYLCWASGNTLTTVNNASPNNAMWLATSTTDGFVLKNKADNTRKLQYNSGSPRFACYTSSQKPAVLYVYDANAVAPETVAAPTLPANNIFTDSYEVAITCATEGATIKYSTDEQATWNTYSAPFTITQTTTVYAQAFKGNAESEIVNATYTKDEPITGVLIIFNYEDDQAITTAQEYTVTRPGASFTVSNGMINGHYRIYKNQTIAFKSTAGKILRIEFDGLADNPASNFGNVVGMGYEGSNGVWIGSADSISFTASLNQVRCTEIRVYVEGPLPTDYVEKPVITPASQNFDESIEVTIACATEGATIKYSTDEQATWNDYSTALTFTETTTVYAKAVKGEKESEVASATYTKNEPAPAITTLAQANAVANNTEFTFEGTDDVVVTYQNGKYTFLRDATGYGNFYQADSAHIANMPVLQNGQVLNPGWTAIKDTFNNFPEYKNATNVSASEDTNAELAAPFEITALNDTLRSAYVTVKNIKKFAVSGKTVTITLIDNTTMKGYNQFNIDLTEMPTTEGEYTAIGIVGKYNTNLQLWIIDWDGQGTPEPDPTEVYDPATANALEDGTKISYANDVAATYQ
ncbi:MAG: chitobiase/beta-hexosaminidase C-terminal domain-containing protein, partial [Muribaculaceae bacterium]|nr:chitobiase/beta-hexosaminidase C-terminal domain-containing protein [Muribaculaceae bacterium]